MADRNLPPFRADHVGSLLRPPELLDARARHRAGDLDDAGLRAAEDMAIRGAVALQRESGVRTATDGEFRRTAWHMDFIYQLGGVDSTDQKLAVHFHNKGGDLDFETAALSVHDRVGLVLQPIDKILIEALPTLQLCLHIGATEREHEE